MASNKTPNLGLDTWAEMDYFKRAELNSNFTKLDTKAKENSDKIGALQSDVGSYGTDLSVLKMPAIIASGIVTIDTNPNYDNSAYLNNLINTAPKGAKIIIPRGRIKANIQVTQSDVIIDHTSGGELSGSSYITPFDVTKPCFLIGGTTSHVRGVTIPNLTLYGTNNEAHTVSHGLVIKGVRDLNIDNLKSEYFGGHNIMVTSENLYTSYVNINKIKARYSKQSNFYIEKGSVYTSAVYLGFVQFLQNDPAVNARNVTIKDGADLYITNGWMQGMNLKCIDLYGPTSRLFLNNVYIDSDNTNDILINHVDTAIVNVVGSFICDGFIQLKGGSAFKHSSGYLNGFPRTIYHEVLLTDTVNYVDVLELGSPGSYKITIASCDNSNANVHAFIELHAQCSGTSISKQSNAISNNATYGIDFQWKSNTDGTFTDNNDRRILQLKPRNSLGDKWIIKIEIFARREFGATPNVRLI